MLLGVAGSCIQKVRRLLLHVFVILKLSIGGILSKSIPRMFLNAMKTMDNTGPSIDDSLFFVCLAQFSVIYWFVVCFFFDDL
jgi:hypothetical protein